MRAPTVSAGMVAGLRDYLDRRGAAADPLLQRSGLEGTLLDDPDRRIPLARYLALLRWAQVDLDDPLLALRYGANVGMSELSILGLIMETAPTMGEALHQLDRYGRLALEIDDGSPQPRLMLERPGARLLLVEQRSPASDPDLTEEAFARLVCGPRRFLPDQHVLAVRFGHSPRAPLAEYESALGCPVTFDAAHSYLELHPEVAGWPVAQHPRYVFGVLREKADVLLLRAEPPAFYRERVEALLRATLHDGSASADAVAQRLGLSRSTLFRQLREEGTTYTEVLDTLRRDLAMNYLRSGKLSVNQIAYFLGFSEPASFSRAFRRWAGRAPGRFRTEATGRSGHRSMSRYRSDPDAT